MEANREDRDSRALHFAIHALHCLRLRNQLVKLNKTQNLKELYTKETPVIAVTMGTSRQGIAVTSHLAMSNKFKVRVITRNPRSNKAIQLSRLKNVEVVKGDLLEAKSLRDSFDGVHGIFGNTTPTTGWKFIRGSMVRDYEMEQGKNLIEEVHYSLNKGNLKHFIFSSVCKPKDPLSNHPAPGHFTSKWDIEEFINSKHDLKEFTTVLRPVSYFENFENTLAGVRISKRIFPGLVQGSFKWQTIAVDDIGQWAKAIYLNSKDFLGKSLNIAGEDFTGEEMAELLEKVFNLQSGSSKYLSLPRQLVHLIEEDLAIMANWIERTGYGADLNLLKSLSIKYGIKKTSLLTWLRNNIKDERKDEHDKSIFERNSNQWETSNG